MLTLRTALLLLVGCALATSYAFGAQPPERDATVLVETTTSFGSGRKGLVEALLRVGVQTRWIERANRVGELTRLQALDARLYLVADGQSESGCLDVAYADLSPSNGSVTGSKDLAIMLTAGITRQRLDAARSITQAVLDEGSFGCLRIHRRPARPVLDSVPFTVVYVAGLGNSQALLDAVAKGVKNFLAAEEYRPTR
jgi:hypothetical protein